MALLPGKVVIVSGIGPGYGRELALGFAREGADLVLGARTASYLEEVASEVEELGQRAVFVPTDITDAAACDALAGAAVHEFGRIDVLVNNAARPDRRQPFDEVDLDSWRRVVETNLFGSLNLTHSVIPTMKKQGAGAIVFVNSMIIRQVLPDQGGYALSKAALLTAAQALAKELGPAGIRVNTVVPGWMWGASVEAHLEKIAPQTGKSVEQWREEIVSNIPLGFIPSSADCVGPAVFFASELSSAITGQSIDVNGGEVFAK
jgi:NAD(P)-dependent dehydrogenase (short-subunit alcohol dehydrogenase family)